MFVPPGFPGVLCALVVGLGAPPERLLEEVERIAARPELQTSLIAVHAVRVDTGEVLLDLNGQKLLAPASTTKLLTCAGALWALGKDFRFETRVVGLGPVRAGILQGDLVLVASGDPNLSQRTTRDGRLLFEDKDHSYAGFFDATVVPGDPLSVVKDLARQVQAAGITEVAGDLVVDDGLFLDSEDDFVGPLSAVCVNDNLVDITVRPGERVGDPARIELSPRGTLVEVSCNAVTGHAGSETLLDVEDRPGVASFVVTGRIAADSPPILRVGSFATPALSAAGYLRDALVAGGVKVRGRDLRRRLGPGAYEAREVLARHVSPPLSETLRVILKVSQNLHSTMLLPLLGALRGAAGTRPEGLAVIRRELERRALDPDGIVLQSGSGGGRADSLTPRWITALLQGMANSPDLPLFLELLPRGGVDGTLASAFRDPDLGKRVRAKTGTLVYRGDLGDRWVFVSKSLAGYLDVAPAAREAPAREGLVAFSIVIANTLAATRKKGADDLFAAQESLLRALLDAAARKD